MNARKENEIENRDDRSLALYSDLVNNIASSMQD